MYTVHPRCICMHSHTSYREYPTTFCQQRIPSCGLAGRPSCRVYSDGRWMDWFSRKGVRFEQHPRRLLHAEISAQFSAAHVTSMRTSTCNKPALRLAFKQTQHANVFFFSFKGISVNYPQIGHHIHLRTSGDTDARTGHPKLAVNVRLHFKRNSTKINKLDANLNKPDNFHWNLDKFCIKLDDISSRD